MLLSTKQQTLAKEGFNRRQEVASLRRVSSPAEGLLAERHGQTQMKHWSIPVSKRLRPREKRRMKKTTRKDIKRPRKTKTKRTNREKKKKTGARSEEK